MELEITQENVRKYEEKPPRFKINVIDIYPCSEKFKSKTILEKGMAHVEFKTQEWSIEIQNINYALKKDKTVWVRMPVLMHKDSFNKGKFVEVYTINFNHVGIFDKIRKVVAKEVLDLFFPKKKPRKQQIPKFKSVETAKSNINRRVQRF